MTREVNILAHKARTRARFPLLPIRVGDVTLPEIEQYFGAAQVTQWQQLEWRGSQDTVRVVGLVVTALTEQLPPGRLPVDKRIALGIRSRLEDADEDIVAELCEEFGLGAAPDAPKDTLAHGLLRRGTADLKPAVSDLVVAGVNGEDALWIVRAAGPFTWIDAAAADTVRQLPGVACFNATKHEFASRALLDRAHRRRPDLFGPVPVSPLTTAAGELADEVLAELVDRMALNPPTEARANQALQNLADAKQPVVVCLICDAARVDSAELAEVRACFGPAERDDGRVYRYTDEIKVAIDVALATGRPILLRGRPSGT